MFGAKIGGAFRPSLAQIVAHESRDVWKGRLVETWFGPSD